MFTAVLLLALLCYGVIAAVQANRSPSHGVPIDRSWLSGSLDIDLQSDSTDTSFPIHGSFPDANPGLVLKYDVWLAPDGGNPVFVLGGTMPIKKDFNLAGGYHHAGGYHPQLIGVPIKALLDYEIWQGEAGHGTLLSKSTVVSKSLVISASGSTSTPARGAADESEQNDQ